MVKFSKELEAQLIPEWKDAFVNYWQLKKHVKKVKLSRVSSQTTNSNNNHDYGFSIFDPVRSLLSRLSCNKPYPPDDQIIQVKSTISEQHDGDSDGDGDVDVGAEDEDDETELVNHLYSEEEEVKAFFEKLDEELDKVNQFYTDKETEFLERGEMLKKQLQILLDLQEILECRRRERSNSRSTSGRFNSSPASSGFLRSYSRSYSSGRHTSDSETAS